MSDRTCKEEKEGPLIKGKHKKEKAWHEYERVFVLVIKLLFLSFKPTL